MRNRKVKGSLERGAAADLWRNTLAQIPSVFGRLVYLSSLRDLNSGRYVHHGLAQIFGEEEAHKALEESHYQAFTEWLTFNLEQQKADLDLYLSAFTVDKPTIVQTWLRLAPYRNLAPASVRELEYRLYLTDLETLLELLKNECSVSVPDPDA
jgi:secreted Zn-dependent insulinase-like peptidase